MTKKEISVIIGFRSKPGKPEISTVLKHEGDIYRIHTTINVIIAIIPAHVIDIIRKYPNVEYVEYVDIQGLNWKFVSKNLFKVLKMVNLGLIIDNVKCLKYSIFGLIREVNIEINTSCNRKCDYCPNSISDRSSIKNERLMETTLFEKIIDDLAEIKFDGIISPHFYGEPLLDKRVVKLLKYVREKLPKVRILLVSNGDFLNIEKYNEFVDIGVDFNITQHGKEINKNMIELFEYIKRNSNKNVEFHFKKFYPTKALYNRGGLIKYPLIDYKPRCSLYNLLVIDYNGDVVLCCNDYFSSTKFGNLREKSIIEIWNSKTYRDIRTQLKNHNYKLDICKKCTGTD